MEIRNIETCELTIAEWNGKLLSSDDEWLLNQYYGLMYLVDIFQDDIDRSVGELSCKKENIPDEEYREKIYPLEDRLMEIDTQLVSVEDEIDRRGLMIDIEDH